ncbi:MAG: hypothetical protein ACM3SV_13995 [Betaproteobacteria bacterium]
MKYKFILAVVVAFSALVVGCSKKETPPSSTVVVTPPATPTTTPSTAATTPTTLPGAAATSGVIYKSVALGTNLGGDKKVTSPTTTFAPNDTIYAVVETDGVGKATVKAVFTFVQSEKSAPVSDTTQTIDATGPAFTEFHVAKPGGWPVGDYKVDVFINGAPVGTQTFTVK